MKFTKLGVLLLTTMIFFYSCSSESEYYPTEPIVSIEQQGRFDNSPFKWDEKFPVLRSSDEIFIGDYLFKDTSLTSREVNTKSTNDDIVIDNIPGIYVGAVYPASSVNNGLFDGEIVKAKNPIDLIFDFNSPYIDEVTRETGSIGYKLALKRAINSPDYSSHLKGNTSSRTSYSMTQFSSYEDIVKGFSNNTKVGKMFSAKVEVNRTSQKIKSAGKLFARLENINFSTYMDIPVGGIFKEASRPSGRVEDVYIQSVSYGKIAYLAIESEYSYEKVKWAIEATINVSIIGGSSTTKLDSEVTKVLNKSAITIFAIGDGSSNSYFLDGMENLKELFNSNKSYNINYYGLPIFVKTRYVKSHTAFIPSATTGNSTERPSTGSRPSTGDSTSRPSTGDSTERPSTGRTSTGRTSSR